MTTQNQRVLDYIERHGSITQNEADTIAVKQLASRINDLRREEGVNRLGEKCHWARYRMGARA